ncbi:bifunctional 23S rRNA (guanine(2069)-N(7))-methyltransferase RlmK/23S rRNA (guanine(2445)-N(2))-methyltransferase RlmL [Rubripirellula amarantea]|uniref:bifunctional 23S rRNA (guanine(2069)-N(7))-methyltransferase RlmK/23S rRNA (guanine(2445)-N(2))-methyltransferase RlmL n=1 Tax=Rubripirellula amarantea TaxID=2527999 RepID=UPI0021BC3DB2|nr:bifunctional 23S rRNA (guanine(2069)-N(7))-methyltransferase RlmK/23S rRNA (guanine(2445)-N(2))-methyltransferase RlmL [Rubripirellula amarantea]
MAACAFGLESVVRRELESLEIESVIASSGRVHFQGDWQTLMKTNLWLRTADRILWQVAKFRADDFDALFDQTMAITWGDIIPIDAQFPVTGRAINSQLSSVPAVQRSVKRAVVNAMQRDHHSTELPETGALYKIDIGLLDNEATLTIDTTGRSLHARGYRTDISRAPLKETLAAALVQLSYWQAGRPLIDPFCGSGTIPIEAALIGRKIAPGINREFVFESWPTFDNTIASDLRSDAVSGQLPALETRLLGSDIDGRVLRAARDNAVRAGVDADVHFEQSDVTNVSSRKRFGCLITNPPYGHRIGADEPLPEGGPKYRTRSQENRTLRPHSRELDDLYSSLPDVFRRLPTWSHYVLTAYPQFQSLVGRDADRRRKLYNGRIECTYYQFHGPKPVVEEREHDDKVETLVHAQGEAAFGGLSAKSREQATLFASRLRKRAKHLRRWPTKKEITCFRLYERDIPEIPLIVDRYEDELHITEYERPHDRSPAEHANWLELMAKTAGETLDVPAAKTHLKTRLRQRGKRQHEKVADTNHRIEVREGGLKFLVNLQDYVDTGLFLDHRNTRSMVRDEAKGKRFLNLFAYTGSFTVYAADGGAKSTTSVDLSRSYLDWAWENMRLNEFVGNQHRFVTEDIREFIDTHAPGEAYDLVVLDPPTFSNSKRTEQDWDVARDAVPLIKQIMPLVSSGGVIYFSTNFRRFKLDPQELLSGPNPCSAIHEISRQTVPEDYRNQRIHRCWRIVK